MKARHQTVIPPAKGWAPQTWYHVEVAFNDNNPIHGALFYSGFLNGVNGGPGGYNELAGYEDKEDLSSVVYLRAIKPLITKDEIENIPTENQAGHRTISSLGLTFNPQPLS